ncbi:MAG TPA: adenosine kinase [Caulobacteraceae bacterium]|jgi:sugar/nucleoside kinase (ribokinase family)
MTAAYDVAAIGNAIVDVLARADDAFLAAEGLDKGSMRLIDEAHAHDLYGRMAAGVEASGGSAANTIAGVASFGGRSLFVGKVARDALGDVFTHDIRAVGARFDTPPLNSGAATGRCLINVTPDGERTMCTFLGAAVRLTPDDVDPAAVAAARILYLEGYLFDPDDARAAFGKAASAARAADRTIALSLSDAFVVERHRRALLSFIDTEVDVLFANEAEVESLFECDFETGLAALSGRVKIAVVTRGAKGSIILSGGARTAIAAEPVDHVVDTTGAGDQYAAGFLVGLAGDRPLAECGRLGSLAAAEVIGHFGPRPQIRLADLMLIGGA